MYSRSNIFLFVVFFVVALYSFTGCSPKTNYNVLSFFFDGVPNRWANTDTIIVIDTVAAPEPEKLFKPSFYYHPPFSENKCASCHDKSRMGKLVMEVPGLCFQCHESYAEKNEYTHGPVAGGYCLSCHHPHKTKNKKVLLYDGQNLCLHCHDSKQIFKNDKHNEIKDKNCTECHDPHGRDNRDLLKPESCYQCHNDFNDSFKYLHGPVASGNCMSCHSRHTNIDSKMLTRSGQQICLHCHDSKDVFKSEYHASIGNDNCTECHNPHGGEDNFIFK